MLTSRERRILRQIERQLTASSRRGRTELIMVARMAVLAFAVASLLATTTLTADAALAPAVGAPMVGIAGLFAGWQLLSHCRRHAVGPWLRSRLRPRWRPSRGAYDKRSAQR